ncbi:hypothetical protein [Brumimicrobium oceani]|uniref:VacJ n=1 Tax=Brumimicrobium oceani TaxID=2100725 RepID=A0A2U2XEL6_9FLAO|nr:hypothetical protein [Brumimicrobium oceani]PWH86213.1 hypothetical protein DIT68_02935 [Brumimicrobium oceani]
MNEPITINRNAVLIIPKQAFFDWANSVFPEDPTNATDYSEYNTYLIAEDSFQDNAEEALENYWEFIFENELFDISTDDDDWPKDLTWELFKSFFNFHFSSIVTDLEDNPFYMEN